MRYSIIIMLFFIWPFSGCKTTKEVNTSRNDDGLITLKFIQLNDVYEIAPLSGGKYGGMARVAHIRDSIKALNPNTFLFLAGDFLNPSLLGSLKKDGERIAGKQMIEVMNAMDFDLVTFGNHEFDIGEDALMNRLTNSEFSWSSANVYHVTESGRGPFYMNKGEARKPVARAPALRVQDADGTAISVGFFSVTIDDNPRDFVFYGDPFSEAEEAVKQLRTKADLIIGLTHLKISEDRQLAERFPQVPLIMGGHEHFQMNVRVNNTSITKADANARTVYIHTITYQKSNGNTMIESEVFPVDDRIAEKPEIAAIVDKWNVILDEELQSVIAQPYQVIYHAETPLDGTDNANRATQTNLGKIITEAMAHAFNHDVDAALVNGGSIRIDDELKGDVSGLDIFRVLPFGGSVIKVRIKGGLLQKVLDYGREQEGTGAYLQRYNITENASGTWLVGDEPIMEGQVYTISFSDFLLKGLDIPFLTPENQGVLEVYHPKKEEVAYDIRKAVILFLKSLNSQP